MIVDIDLNDDLPLRWKEEGRKQHEEERVSNDESDEFMPNLHASFGSDSSSSDGCFLEPSPDDYSSSEWGAEEMRQSSTTSDLDHLSDADLSTNDDHLVKKWRSRQQQTERFCLRRHVPRHRSQMKLTTTRKSARNIFDEINGTKTTNGRTTKAVWFDMENIVHHECPVTNMTKREWESCFYSDQDIQRFHNAALNMANSLFLKKNDSKEDSGTSRQRRGSLLAAWWRGSPLPTERDAAETILQAYSTCARAKTETAMANAGNLVHREALQEIYQQQENLVGLEHYCLTPMRGEPMDLRRFILSCVYGDNNSSNGRKHKQRTSDVVLCRNNHEHNQMQSTLAHVCQCISRPSRILAHELAAAQAEVLNSGVPSKPSEKPRRASIF